MIKCFIVISTILICGINGQRLSPCPHIFNYVEDNNNEGRWDGQIHLYTDYELDEISVTVVLDKHADDLGNWFGETVTKDNREFTIRRTDYTLVPGINVTLKFFVTFKDSEIPNVSAIKLNGRTICSARKKIRPFSNSTPYTSSRITSRGTFTTPEPFNKHSTESASSTENIAQLIHQVFGDPTTATPTHKQETSSSTERTTNRWRPTTYACGKPQINASPLILYGNYTREGEWPWHLAIYKNDKGTSKYICGGSLVSDNYVITAAHCVVIPETEQVESTNKFLIYLGTMNINLLSSGIQIAQLSQITVHPKYNHTNFHNDIAILKTARSIEFTELIKPVCLWSGDDNLIEVVGKLGTVVGWGFDGKNTVSENLLRTDMPVVDLGTCVYSHPDFFAKFTSLSSFCAGFRNGSGVCNGDSGSGMVFGKTDDDGEFSWYLRGLVSTSVPLKGKLTCDPFHYIVFTDVAKHMSWIRKVMGGPLLTAADIK